MPNQSSKLALCCVVCQRTFERFPSQPGLYCSRQCQGLARRRRVDLTCGECGNPFTRVQGETRRGRSRSGLLFCSPGCAARWAHKPTEPIARFWSNVVVVDDATSCWLYQRRSGPSQYGVIKIGGARQQAHRFSWEIHFDPIPEGKFVCHRCDTPPCVRPNHLFLGTAADNSADMVAKGRSYTPSGDAHYSRRSPEKVRRGNAAPRSILTEGQVRMIRRRHMSGECTVGVLALEYGVVHATISAVIRRATWAHLDDEATS